MTLDNERCQATTQAGTRCTIRAVEGSVYCHVHQSMEEAVPQSTPPAQAGLEDLPPKSATGSTTQTDINTDMLVRELESLMEELQKRAPGFLPSSATPGQLFAMFNSKLGRYAPETQRQTLDQLEQDLNEATLQDLVDGDTWKGMLSAASNLAYSQALSVSGGIADRVSFLPGAQTVSHLMGNLEGTSAGDLLDPETWQGLWYILNYTAQLQIDQAKQRLRGRSGEGREAEDE